MEIRLCCISISCCVLILSCIEAKSISLNDIIAAKQAAQDSTRRSPLLYSLGTAIPAKIKKTSPLKYRQTFQITSPSNPKKFKIIQKLSHKRKNLNKKREAKHNDGIIQKYIPLLKNIRLLVDDILAADSSETFDHKENKFKRNLFTVNERDDVVCTCQRKSNSKSTLHPQEETITSTAVVATEIQEEIITSTVATTAQTFATFNDNLRRVGRHKNLPILPARNTSSVWRNDSGFGQRSSTTFNRSIEGHIPRNNGNNEHDTREEVGPYTENYEEYTYSDTRDNAGRDRSSERLRRLRVQSRDTEFNRGTIEENLTSPRSETVEDATEHLSEYKRKIEYEIRRNKTESTLPIPESDTRLRRMDSQEEDTLRFAKISKESDTENNASDKQFSDGRGSLTPENQEVRSANEAIAPKHILPNSTYPDGKVVMIFDGYSVAKDVNGANRLTEKAIQIHT